MTVTSVFAESVCALISISHNSSMMIPENSRFALFSNTCHGAASCHGTIVVPWFGRMSVLYVILFPRIPEKRSFLISAKNPTGGVNPAWLAVFSDLPNAVSNMIASLTFDGVLGTPATSVSTVAQYRSPCSAVGSSTRMPKIRYHVPIDTAVLPFVEYVRSVSTLGDVGDFRPVICMSCPVSATFEHDTNSSVAAVRYV